MIFMAASSLSSSFLYTIAGTNWYFSYTLEMQKWIFDTYNDKLTGSKISMMKKNMLKEDIAKIFDVPDIKTRRITIDVPEDLLDEFNKWWIFWCFNGKILAGKKLQSMIKYNLIFKWMFFT